MRDRGAVVAVLCAALAGCFPDFEFGGSTTTDQGGQGGNPSSSRVGSGPTVGSGGRPNEGGDPGQGGVPGHATASSTTGVTTDTSTSTGPVTPTLTVPCGDGAGVIVECATAPESCCLSLEAQSMDHCQDTLDCGTDYYTLTCNGPADCPGEICCALIDDFFGDLLGVECRASCGSGDYVVCADADDCATGETCEQLFTNTFAPEYAPHYRVCE